MKWMLIIGLLLSASVNADAKQNSSVDQLAAKLASFDFLSADFEQIQKDETGELLEESKGRFSLAKPDRVDWRVLEPFRQRIVSNGKKLWNYDEELEQVVVQEFDAREHATPLMILSADREEIAAKYAVKLRAVDERNSRFTLKPLDGDTSVFESLVLSFQGDLITGLEITDGFGQQLLISVFKVSTETIVDNSLFEFVPPEGIDVLQGSTQMGQAASQ